MDHSSQKDGQQSGDMHKDHKEGGMHKDGGMNKDDMGKDDMKKDMNKDMNK